MSALETIFALIVLILVGYLSKRIGLLRSDDAIILNKIVLNIALPALIFSALYSANLSDLNSLVGITVICMLIGIVGGFVVYIFSKIMKHPKKTRWSIISSATLFNSGFMGYPIVLGVFGGVGLVRAIFFDTGSTILFILFGILFALFFGGDSSAEAKRVLTYPPIWAIILGIILNLSNFNIGSFTPQILTYFSGAAIPLIMLSLGLSLDASSLKNYYKEAAIVSSIKLLLAPLIALVIVIILGISGINGKVIIVEAAMPSAMLSLVLAITYELDIKAVSACIFLSTVLSMITLPIIMALL
jgi:hypothetical protein